MPETPLTSFTDFDRCIFEHSKKTILSVLSIPHSTYPEERLDEIFFLQKIRIVLQFPDFDWKLSWILAGKLRHSCRNSSCVSRLRFPVKFSVLKIVQIFFVLFVSWLIQLHFWLNFLRQGLQNCTLRVRGSFRGKTFGVRFFFQFFNRFRIWAKTFRSYEENCAAALSKVHFFRQRNKTRRILFWKNAKTFNNFRTLG